MAVQAGLDVGMEAGPDVEDFEEIGLEDAASMDDMDVIVMQTLVEETTAGDTEEDEEPLTQ